MSVPLFFLRYSSTRFKKPGKSLNAKELHERRAKSLCYYCDKKYVPGHKCKAQIYRIELRGLEEEEKGLEEDELALKNLEEPSIVYEKIPYISINAMLRFKTYKIMKVLRMVKRHSPHILNDSRSTHNFLALGTAKRLSCDIKGTVPLQICMANGSKLY